MESINRITRATYSSANAATTQITVDCELDDKTPPTLARFIIPYEIDRTPDGPKVNIQYAQARVRDEDDTEREIPEDELPQPVKEKAGELSREIGNW